MKILRFHPRPTESEASGAEPRVSILTPSARFRCTPRFRPMGYGVPRPYCRAAKCLPTRPLGADGAHTARGPGQIELRHGGWSGIRGPEWIGCFSRCQREGPRKCWLLSHRQRQPEDPHGPRRCPATAAASPVWSQSWLLASEVLLPSGKLNCFSWFTSRESVSWSKYGLFVEIKKMILKFYGKVLQ